MAEITTSAPSVPAVAPAAPAPSSGTPTGAPPPKTTEVPIDGAELGKWAGLSRQVREFKGKLTAAEARAKELEAKVAEYEGLRPVADKASSVEKLVKEGKLVEAIKAQGIELEAAFAQWVEANDASPTPQAVPKELLELKERYDALEAKLKAGDDEKTKAEEERKAAAQAEARKATTADTITLINSDPARWARCAKAPEEAAEDAFNIAVEKVRLLGRAASDDEAKELFEKALDLVEGARKEMAEKFYIPEAPRKRPATVAQVRDYLKPVPARDSSPVAERKEPAVTLDGQRGSLRTASTETKGKLTESEARAKALASIRTMRRAQ